MIHDLLVSRLRSETAQKRGGAKADLPLLEKWNLASLGPDTVLRSRQLWDAIGSLTPRQREALVAHRLMGLTIAETAKDLGVSEATVKKDLHRAFVRLRQDRRFLA
jgi:DNA-directed RNA polymerase specialized sigma24 family protein